MVGWPEIARDVATAVGLPADVAYSVMEVLGDRGILELGTLVHQYGLTRKLTQNIQRYEQYAELRATLADRMGVSEDEVGPLLRSMLREIGSVVAESPEQLAQAKTLFGEVGDLVMRLGLIDGGDMKVALHQAVGDALAGTDGAAAAGNNELLMPLLVELAGGSPERLLALSRIVGGVSGDNAATGAWVAEQGTRYNRQLHQGELEAIRDNAKRYAEEQGMSESQALTYLLLEGLRQVDGSYAEHISSNPEASAFLNRVAAENPDMQITSSSGYQGGLFQASDADYLDASVNAFYLRDMEYGMGYPVRNALLDGAGSWMVDSEAIREVYWPVLESADRYAASQQLKQLAIPVAGLVAIPAVASGGVATYGVLSTQGQFWGGVASHTGLRWMQSAGATGQANLWAAGNAGRYGVARANMLGAEMVYGTGKAATGYTMVTGAGGFLSGVSGGIPGTPPAYIPDGLPTAQVLAPWQTGEAVGAGIRDGLFIFKNVYEE